MRHVAIPAATCLLSAALLPAAATAQSAMSPLPEDPQRSDRAYTEPSLLQIAMRRLAAGDLPKARFAWAPGHFEIAEQGLRYQQDIRLGGQPVQLRVQGPVQRHGAFGLGLQFTF